MKIITEQTAPWSRGLTHNHTGCASHLLAPRTTGPLRRSAAKALVVLCGTVALGIVPLLALAVPMLHAPFHPFLSGEDCRSVAMGDVNGDGLPDLVTSNRGSGTISILIAIGNGDFGPAVNLAIGDSPDEVVIGEVTGDGVPDLVVVTSATGSFKVLAGTGDGTFGPATDHPSGSNLRRAVVMDVNHDARADVVACSGDFLGAASLQVFLGGAGGSLTPLPAKNLGWTGPVGFAFGDVNGDGHVDVVTAHNVIQATVLVTLGNGDGTFAAPLTLFDQPSLSAVTLADLNRDGKLDLVLGGSGSPDHVSVRLGVGNGTFGATLVRPLGSFTRPAAFATGDLDRDGLQDLVVAVPGGMLFLPGLGNGGFGSSRTFNCSSTPLNITIGDLDGDGMLDLAVPGAPIGESGTPGVVSVILGDGRGGSRGPVLASDVGCFSVAAGDLNGDGLADLVTSNFDGHTVSALLGAGGGRFRAPLTFSPGGSPWRVALGDLNNDGRPDLVLTFSGDLVAMSVQDGLGNGAFGPRRDLMGNPNFTGESFAAVGDFNQDGNQDLVMVNRFTNALSLFLGTGNGSFPTHVEYPTGDQPMWVAVGDVNRDGRPDLVVANVGSFPAPGVLACYIGRGDGTFLAPIFYSTSSSPVCVAIADLNGDRWPDLVSRGVGSSTVSVLLGDGTGGFGAHMEYLTSTSGWWVGIGRLDGDAIPDLVAANTIGSTLTLLHGVGDGSFVSARDYGIGINPMSGAMLDSNADGQLDVAVANRGSSNLGLLLSLPGVPVATELSLVDFDAQFDRVRLAWSASGRVVSADVQRLGRESGWTPLARVASDGTGRIEYEDREVSSGEEYDYRLVEPGPAGRVLAGSVHVVVPSAPRLEIGSPRPNPVVGTAFSVEISVPDHREATLDLLDLSGRFIERQRIHPARGGRISVPLGSLRPLAPGLYLLRLHDGAESQVLRVAVLR